MGSRADDIRRRMMKRKKDRERHQKVTQHRLPWADDEERYGFDKLPTYEFTPGEGGHPLFRKEVFLFKILCSACLVLIVAVLFRSQAEQAEPARNYIKHAMESEFRFVAVSDWYEKKFGKPLALLPLKEDSSNSKKKSSGTEYALEASGKIIEDFGANGQRITIETGKGTAVEAMNEGLVSFAGVKEGFGKTVIIQHADKSESWYGNLDKIDVSLMEYIDKGRKVGTPTESADGTKGAFYFAIKKGDDFVDPIPVIRFE
ncbi:M23 family metallopeptidase [Bacillus sp. T33-2]|uniref:M23 family metallopeptidase n=1 Tax=Bacillus sp. T33-2 TaxID=2054168 RepID=UPI000C763F52|nr:M23 family metallopeptidase [Bacillus sp. T33-2]PLR93853.1 peptidase M23 [Bacillus sp. T33-2]